LDSHAGADQSPRRRFFAPLRDLQKVATRIYLGLLHYQDGVEGTLARVTVARRFLPDFGIATECGLGRRSLETLIDMLTITATSPIACPRTPRDLQQRKIMLECSQRSARKTSSISNDPRNFDLASLH
jgi:hypothetical protein